MFPDLGVDGAGGGRNLVRAGAGDRHRLTGISLEESAALAEGEGALDDRRLRVALPGGARVVRLGARTAPRTTGRASLSGTMGTAAQTLSLSEQARAAQIGGWLFRHRGLLPIPLSLLAAFVPGTITARAWIVGLSAMALGEALRLAGVAVAGPGTRRRSRGVAHLVTDGPFAWVRNPLYLGNGLAWLGVAIVAGVPWLIPVAISTFAAQYGLIVRYEEGVLESLFGEAYLAYKGRTPRWFPRRPSAGPRPVGRHYAWSEACRSEVSTFVSLGVAIVILALKTAMG